MTHTHAGKDLLPTHLLPGYMGPDAPPMSGLKGLSGIRVKEDPDDDARPVRRVSMTSYRILDGHVHVVNILAAFQAFV